MAQTVDEFLSSRQAHNRTVVPKGLLHRPEHQAMKIGVHVSPAHNLKEIAYDPSRFRTGMGQMSEEGFNYAWGVYPERVLRPMSRQTTERASYRLGRKGMRKSEPSRSQLDELAERAGHRLDRASGWVAGDLEGSSSGYLVRTPIEHISHDHGFLGKAAFKTLQPLEVLAETRDTSHEGLETLLKENSELVNNKHRYLDRLHNLRLDIEDRRSARILNSGRQTMLKKARAVAGEIHPVNTKRLAGMINSSYVAKKILGGRI